MIVAGAAKGPDAAGQVEGPEYPPTSNESQLRNGAKRPGDQVRSIVMVDWKDANNELDEWVAAPYLETIIRAMARRHTGKMKEIDHGPSCIANTDNNALRG